MALSALLNVWVALAIKLESSTFWVMFLKFSNAIRTSSMASVMPGVSISVFAVLIALSAVCIVLLAVFMVSINTDVTSSISTPLSLASSSSIDSVIAPKFDVGSVGNSGYWVSLPIKFKGDPGCISSSINN